MIRASGNGGNDNRHNLMAQRDRQEKTVYLGVEDPTLDLGPCVEVGTQCKSISDFLGITELRRRF